MAVFQKPQMDLVKPEGIYTDAASMFLTQMHQARAQRMEQERVDLEKKRQAEQERVNRTREVQDLERLNLDHAKFGQEQAVAQQNRAAAERTYEDTQKDKEKAAHDEYLARLRVGDFAGAANTASRFGGKSELDLPTAPVAPADYERAQAWRAKKAEDKDVGDFVDNLQAEGFLPPNQVEPGEFKPPTAEELAKQNEQYHARRAEEAEGERLEGVAQGHEAQVAEYEKNRKAAEKTPYHKWVGPDGQTVVRGTPDDTLAFQTKRNEMLLKRQADKYRQLAVTSMARDPFRANYYLRAAEEIEAGGLGNKAPSQFMLDLLKEDNDLQQTYMMMQAAVARAQTAATEREEGTNLRKMDILHRRLDAISTKHKLPGNLESFQKLRQRFGNVESANAFLQAGARAGLLDDMVTGVPSDTDLKMTIKDKAGVIGSLESLLQGAEDGTLGDRERVALSQALAKLVRDVGERIRNTDAAYRALAADPTFAEYGARLNTEHEILFGSMPDYVPLAVRPTQPSRGRGATQPRGGGGGSVSVSGHPSRVDAIMKRYQSGGLDEDEDDGPAE